MREYLPVALFGLVFFGLPMLRRWQTKRRRSGLQVWALSRDYSYTPEAPDLVDTYSDLPMKTGGTRMRFRNVIQGRLAGYPLTGFDFSYETSTSKSTTVHSLQVLAVELPIRLPLLRVTRQGLGARVAIVFGGQDIVIGDDAFDQAFRVRADDEAAVRRLLLPMAPALLARTDQDLQTDGSMLLVIRSGTLSDDDIDEWIADLKPLVIAASSR